MLHKLLITFFAIVALASPVIHIDEERAIKGIDSARGLDERGHNTELRAREPDPNDPWVPGYDWHDDDHGGDGLKIGGHSCPGKLVDGPIKFADGRCSIYLFYSTQDGGTNCAYIENETGVEMEMYISLYKRDDLKSESWDHGLDYKDYAGSARVKDMSGECVGLDAVCSYWSGRNILSDWWGSAQKFPRGWHCGK